MKKILTGIAIFIVGAFVMELVASHFGVNNPKIDKIVIDSIYNDRQLSDSLGSIQSAEFNFDSVSTGVDVVKFSLSIQGQKRLMNWQGEAIKERGLWQVSALRRSSNKNGLLK